MGECPRRGRATGAPHGRFPSSEIAAGRRYLPASANILRAFTIPFDSIKVLIVGQDPYPTPGHPVGLSFCVRPMSSHSS